MQWADKKKFKNGNKNYVFFRKKTRQQKNLTIIVPFVLKLEGRYIITYMHEIYFGEMHKTLLIVDISGEKLKD